MLIVEDETLIALDLEAQLIEAGYGVLGPFARPDAALRAIDESPPSAALLDFNLGGGIDASEVGRRLGERGVPFAFMSGYSATQKLQALALGEHAVLPKPCDPARIVATLEAMTRPT